MVKFLKILQSTLIIKKYNYFLFFLSIISFADFFVDLLCVYPNATIIKSNLEGLEFSSLEKPFPFIFFYNIDKYILKKISENGRERKFLIGKNSLGILDVTIHICRSYPYI